MKAKIAVLVGDGVGREIVPEAVKVLKAVAEKFQHTFEFFYGDVGGQAIDKVGLPLPQQTLTLAKQSDAVLLGAVGGPKWEGLELACVQNVRCWDCESTWASTRIYGLRSCIRCWPMPPR